MAFQKKTKEEWAAIRKENSLKKTVENVEVIRDAVKAASIGGDANTALLTVLISELMKLNDQIMWIQKGMQKRGQAVSDDVPF